MTKQFGLDASGDFSVAVLGRMSLGEGDSGRLVVYKDMSNDCIVVGILSDGIGRIANVTGSFNIRKTFAYHDE